MRITIKGNATAENFKEIVDSLNEEFAPIRIRVKNATCYFRFENEEGELVEPVIPEEKKKPKELKPQKK